MHFCFCTRLNWGSTGVYLCSPPHLWYHLQTQTIEVRPRVSGLSAPCPSSSPGSFEGKAYVSASASCDSGRTADAPRRHLKSPRTDFKVSGHLSFSSLSFSWHPRVQPGGGGRRVAPTSTRWDKRVSKEKKTTTAHPTNPAETRDDHMTTDQLWWNTRKQSDSF